jgi:hypothetical protein
MLMGNVNARTAPIAAILAGAIIISAGVYGYEFGTNPDALLTAIIVLVGCISLISGLTAYLWERNKYYKDRLEPHLFP